MKNAADKKKAAETATRDFETMRGFREIVVQFKSAKSIHPDDLKRLRAAFPDHFARHPKFERVAIYQTRAKDIARYHELFCGNDMEAFAEFLCRKPAGWGALIAAESIIEITEKIGPEVNDPLWRGWFRALTKRNEALMPGSTDIVAKTLALLMQHRKAANASSPSDAKSPNAQ